jgi:hypothetical protein
MMRTIPVLVMMTGIPPRVVGMAPVPVLVVTVILPRGIGVRVMIPTTPVMVTGIPPRRVRIRIVSFEADSGIAARAGHQHAEAAEE